MELTHDFRVPVPPERAWDVLTDVERIAPCLPGAQLQEIEGEEYRGVVKVKVGPITAQYKGKATFAERDQSGGRIVLRCEGRDTRGQGNANATITVTLQGDSDGTDVHVVTDMTVTGKVAQFGRGVMADVSSKLLDQFAACLHDKVLQGESAGDADAGSSGPAAAAEAATSAAPQQPAAATSAAPQQPAAATSGSAAPAATSVVAPPGEGPNGQVPAPASSVRTVDHPEPEPVDLLEEAGPSIAKRVGPVLVVVIAVVVLVGWRRRRSLAGR
jgi:carbon monoxide dehydrogenase subunit G